jgi:hypothetical protein
MIRSTIMLDGELVLTCADCGAESTDDIAGADGWTLRRVSAQRLVDICPACAPARAKPLKKAGALPASAGIQSAATDRDSVMLPREVAPRRATGLAIGRTPHLSTERCRECGAELRDAVEGEFVRDGVTVLADFCRYCDTPMHLVRKDVLL